MWLVIVYEKCGDGTEKISLKDYNRMLFSNCSHFCFGQDSMSELDALTLNDNEFTFFEKVEHLKLCRQETSSFNGFLESTVFEKLSRNLKSLEITGQFKNCYTSHMKKMFVCIIPTTANVYYWKGSK